MTQRVVTRRRGWRRRTIISLLIALIMVSGLIYWEQTGLLYLFSTLFICTLLSLVAFADLEGREKELSQPVQPEAQQVLATRPAPRAILVESWTEPQTTARSSFSTPSENTTRTDVSQR